MGGRADAETVRSALDRMLSDDRYARAAAVFAGRYADFDPARQKAAMVTRVERLLPAG